MRIVIVRNQDNSLSRLIPGDVLNYPPTSTLVYDGDQASAPQALKDEYQAQEAAKLKPGIDRQARMALLNSRLLALSQQPDLVAADIKEAVQKMLTVMFL